MVEDESLTLSGLAKRADCSARRIQLLTDCGFIKPLGASHEGSGVHRKYGPEVIRKVIFAKHFVDLGFRLTAIQALWDKADINEGGWNIIVGDAAVVMFGTWCLMDKEERRFLLARDRLARSPVVNELQ